MKLYKIAFLKIFFLTLAGPSMAQDITDLSQFEFMLGDWGAEFPQGAFYESWTKESDTKFTGEAYKVFGGDSSLSEILTLEVIYDGYHNGVYYIAQPVLQDTTYFQFVAGTNEDAEFQNPEHDFPQRIAYRKVSDDELFVIEDNLDQTTNKQLVFNFKRRKK